MAPCDAVGKRAATLPSSIHMPRIDLGIIVGVTWMAAGAAIGAPDQDRPVQHALRDDDYFIVSIDGPDGALSLRPVSRIEPR